jgi:hypothetical protein
MKCVVIYLACNMVSHPTWYVKVMMQLLVSELQSTLAGNLVWGSEGNLQVSVPSL